MTGILNTVINGAALAVTLSLPFQAVGQVIQPRHEPGGDRGQVQSDDPVSECIDMHMSEVPQEELPVVDIESILAEPNVLGYVDVQQFNADKTLLMEGQVQVNKQGGSFFGYVPDYYHLSKEEQFVGNIYNIQGSLMGEGGSFVAYEGDVVLSDLIGNELETLVFSGMFYTSGNDVVHYIYFDTGESLTTRVNTVTGEVTVVCASEEIPGASERVAFSDAVRLCPAPVCDHVHNLPTPNGPGTCNTCFNKAGLTLKQCVRKAMLGRIALWAGVTAGIVVCSLGSGGWLAAGCYAAGISVVGGLTSMYGGAYLCRLSFLENVGHCVQVYGKDNCPAIEQ